MTGRALVTGAGQRLGRSMAEYLGARGFDVAVHFAGSANGAEQAAAQIRDSGQNAVTLQADLLQEDAMQALLPRAAAALGGPITCLVNNASIFEYDTVQTATRDSWDRHFESNLRAPFVLTQAMAAQGLEPDIDARGEPVSAGVIVNMIDQRVRKLTPEFTSYTLAKLGLWTLTQTAAQSLAPVIRVNAIGPGPTLKAARQSEAHFSAQRKATILERGANLDDINRTLGFLIDSPSVTGQLFCVDGGQHLAWRTPDIQGPE